MHTCSPHNTLEEEPKIGFRCFPFHWVFLGFAYFTKLVTLNNNEQSMRLRYLGLT